MMHDTNPRERSRKARRGIVLACSVSYVLSFSANARAHNSEWLAGLAQHPGDSNVLVLRYESGYGGLLVSRDKGASFQIRPGFSFTTSSIQGRTPILIHGDGTFAIGLGDGLFEDDGSGCALQANPAIQGWVSDLARHPAQPDVSFILTSGGSKSALRTGLWRRDATGAIEPIGANDTGVDEGEPSYQKPLFFSQSLRVVVRQESAEQLRFVEVGSKNTYASATSVQRTPTFRYSDDLGATWTEHPLPTDPADGIPLLVAVAPGNPLKAIVAIPRAAAQEIPDAVLITSDGGEHFQPYIEGITQVGPSLVTPDGSLFIADMGWTAPNPPLCPPPAGLWHAPAIGEPAERIMDDAVSCLGYEPAQQALYVCKAYEFGLFHPSNRSYCQLFKMNETSSLVSCAGEDILSKVDGQLCGNWCGALHYSSSPFCADTSCQAFARDYDLEAGWVEPPGVGAPRCTDFVPTDAGSSRGAAGCGADASVDEDAGLEGDGAATDSGPSAVTDSGPGTASDGGNGDTGTTVVNSPHDGGATSGADADPDADASLESPLDTDDGCDCSVRAGQKKLPDLAGVSVGLWLFARSVRARKRRANT